MRTYLECCYALSQPGIVFAGRQASEHNSLADIIAADSVA